MKEVEFAIKGEDGKKVVIGETSGEEFVGTFKALPVLTHFQQLRLDEIRREFLGSNPMGATARAQNQAMIFAELAVHLTDAPIWWKESNSGQNLYDDNVVAAVYAGLGKVREEFQADLKKRTEAAKKDLEQVAAK
jgi:hypothetical protein